MNPSKIPTSNMLERNNNSEPRATDNAVDQNVGLDQSVSEKTICNAKSTITTCTRTSISNRPKSSAYEYKPPNDKVFSLKKKSNTNSFLDETDSSNHTIRKATQSKTVATKTAGAKTAATKNAGTKNAASKADTTKSVVTILPPKNRSVDPPSGNKKEEKKSALSQNYAIKGAKKNFESQKKKVEIAQTDLLNSYHMLQQVLNKQVVDGKPPPKEEIKLMSVVIDDMEDFLLKVNGKPVKPNKNATTGKILTDILKLDAFKSTYSSFNDTCGKMCQAILEQFTNLSPESGDTAADGKDLQQIAKLVETQITAIKDQMNTFSKTVSELDTIPVKPVPDKSAIVKPYEKEISRLNEELTRMASALSAKTAEMKDLTDSVRKLRSQLSSRESTLLERKQEITKINQIKKAIEDDKRDLEKKIATLNENIAAKNSSIKKLTNEVDVLKTRSKKNDGVLNDFKKQEEEIARLKEKEEEARKKYRDEHEKCLGLKYELSERDSLIAKLNDDIANEKTSKVAVGDDLQDLQRKLEQALKEKDEISKEKNDLKTQIEELNIDDLKSDLLEMKNENSNLKKANESLRTNIASLEKSLHKKQKHVNELEKNKEQWSDVETTVNQLKAELSRIHLSEHEKNLQLEKLKHDLSNALLDIKEHEETIINHQRLLRVRNELIVAHQEKEAKAISQMEDLHAEISKKTALINEMNFDMAAKSEDFENLYSTLASQQTDLSRQEQKLKVLQETNDKYKQNQKKLNEKILTVQRENAELKHLLVRYENQKRTK